MKCKYCGGKLKVCYVFGFYVTQCTKCNAIFGQWKTKDEAEEFVRGGVDE